MKMDEMHEHVTNDEIQRLIKKSVSGKRDWRVLAKIILEYEKQNLWKGEATSFSAWLKQFAGQLDFHIANLWRFRRAAKASFVFWGKQGQRRISSLMDIPDGVCPESIEILEKISRAAPSYVVKGLATRLFAKNITVKELRATWNKFRFTLSGDARGRNKEVPKLPRGDERRKGILFQNIVIELFGKLKSEELGYETEYPMVILPNVLVPEGNGQIDSVIVVETGTGDIDIHGIEILCHVSDAKPKLLEDLQRCCDFVWLAVAEMPSPDSYTSLNGNIGLIHVGDSSVNILKIAKWTESEYRDQMARRVIRKFMN